MLSFFKHYWVLILLSSVGISYIINLTLQGHVTWLTTFDLLPPLLSAAGTYYAVRRTTREVRFFWQMVTLGSLCYFAAQAIWFGYAAILGVEPPPISIGDLFWFLQNVLFIIGLAKILRVYSSTAHGFRFVVDALMTMLTLSVLSMELVVKPYLSNLSGEEGLLTVMLNLFYPVSDLVIVICLYTVLTFSPKLFGSKQLRFLTAGLVLYVIVDTAYVLLVASDDYFVGSWIDPLFNLALLLIGYAGLSQEGRKESAASTGFKLGIPDFPTPSIKFIGHYVPYLCLAILMVLVLLRIERWDTITVTGTVLFVILLFRQISVLMDYDILVSRYRDLSVLHEFMAQHDSLTELPNRRHFLVRMDEKLQKADAADQGAAVMFMYVKNFKGIGDSMGFPFGDKLIAAVSGRIAAQLQENHLLGRWSDDEFTLLVPEPSNQEEIIELASRLIHTVSVPYFLGKYEVRTAIQVGISFSPRDGRQGNALLQKAYVALQQAKKLNVDLHLYTPEIEYRLQNRIDSDNELRLAFQRGDLVLMYQPQFTITDMQLVGVEALLRWKRADGVTLSPGAFLPLAKEAGMLEAIGEWALRRACQQAMEWKRKGYTDLSMSVNVSLLQLVRPEFGERVTAILRETGMNPRQLTLELQENETLDPKTAGILQRLQAQGLRIAMGGFGAAFSSLSLSNLQQLRADCLKVSQDMMREVVDKPETRNILVAIQSMAHSLRMSVVAEGVENKEILDLLKEYSIDAGQGYYFSYPLTAEELEKRFMLTVYQPDR